MRKYGILWTLSTDYVFDPIEKKIENMEQNKDLLNELPFCETSAIVIVIDDGDTSDIRDSTFDYGAVDYDISTHLNEMIRKNDIHENSKCANVCLRADLLQE